MEKHSVSRLIGAPPGYVGYDEGGALTEAVRRKAVQRAAARRGGKGHPDVSTSAAGAGRRSADRRPGRTVDFKTTVIVMTSNLGSQMIMQMSGQSTRRSRRGVGRGQAHFRPEFLNRIDETVVFHASTRSTREHRPHQLRQLESRLDNRR